MVLSAGWGAGSARGDGGLRGKSHHCGPGGARSERLPEAPMVQYPLDAAHVGTEREPKRRSGKDLRSQARDPAEKSSGATDRRFLQAPQTLQETQPVVSPGLADGTKGGPGRAAGGTIP